MFLLKIQIFIFYVFGFVPFTYKTNNNAADKKKIESNTITFVPTEVHTFYNLILIIVIIVVNSIYIPASIQDHYSKDDMDLSATLSIAISLSGNSVLIILLLSFIVQRQKIIKLVNQLLDIDVAMKKLHHIYKPDCEKIELLFICYVNTIPCVMIMVLSLHIDAKFISTMCLFTFHTFAFNYLIIQYAILLTIIEKKLKCCNDGFLKLKKSIELQFRVYNTQKNTLDKTSIIEIFALKRCHTILCRLCSDIADFYSFGFLYIIPYSIVCVILNIYDLLIPFLDIYSTENITTRRIGNIAWIMSRLFPILTIAVCATKVSKQVRNHELNNSILL